jgi:hypothetical protein
MERKLSTAHPVIHSRALSLRTPTGIEAILPACAHRRRRPTGIHQQLTIAVPVIDSL